MDGRGHFETFLADRLVESILIEASYMFVHTNETITPWRKKCFEESYRAYTFMSGTGFEVMLETYDIGYDPNQIRSSFRRMFCAKS